MSYGRIPILLRKYIAELDSRADDRPPEVQRLLMCLHIRLFEADVSVTEIRARCGLRNNNVTTRFRAAAGMGIREYITTQRLKAAAFVLSRIKVNVYVLAAAVGYGEETFSKPFKRAYGCSPLTYHHLQYRDGVGDGELTEN